MRAIGKTPVGEPISSALIRAAIHDFNYVGTLTHKRVGSMTPEHEPLFVYRQVTAAKGMHLSAGGRKREGERESWDYDPVIETDDLVEWDGNTDTPEPGMVCVGALHDGTCWDFGPYRVYRGEEGDLRVSRIWHSSYPLERLRIVGRVVRLTQPRENFGGMKVRDDLPVFDSTPEERIKRQRSNKRKHSAVTA